MQKGILLALMFLLVSCVPSQIFNSTPTPTTTPTTTPTSTQIPPTITSTALPPTPTATHRYVSFLYKYSFLISALNYFLPPDGPIVVAYPLDENGIFFVVRMRVYSGTELCPGDLDWMLTEDSDWITVDETQSGLKPIGFGSPLGQELGIPNPSLLIGSLTGGCIVVSADSNETFIDLIYVVSKDFTKGIIINHHWPQRVYANDYTRNVYAIYPSLVIIGDEEIPAISCESCAIEQLDGSENWTYSP